MICDTKSEWLQGVFAELDDRQVRVMALLALERMWMPFVNGLSTGSEKELKKNVLNCLEMLWQQALYGITGDIRVEYKRCLNNINRSANEENPEAEFTTPHPLYLIGQLFSGLISLQGDDLKEACKSAVVRPLDMIYDALFDMFGIDTLCESHSAIQEELHRIDSDILLVNPMPKSPYTAILSRRFVYHQLEIVPLK